MLHGCVDAHIARLVMQTYRPRIRTLAEDSALCPRPWAPDLLRVIVKFVVSTCALIFRPRVLRLSVCPCLRVRNKTPVLQFKWNTWPLPCGSRTRLFRCLLAHAHVQAPGTKRARTALSLTLRAHTYVAKSHSFVPSTHHQHCRILTALGCSPPLSSLCPAAARECPFFVPAQAAEIIIGIKSTTLFFWQTDQKCVMVGD